MRYRRLQDRIYRGWGVCARQTGVLGDAFRPVGPRAPLRPENRYLRLHVAFIPPGSNYASGDSFQHDVSHGLFDGSYTQPGDYIICPVGTFFIASQEALQPIICVRTNRVISIFRPMQHAVTTPMIYGAYSPSDTTSLIDGYPASVRGETRAGALTAGLPTAQPAPYWYVLLPAPAAVIVSPGDFIMDDLNRTAVISSAELTYSGWRIHAKMATT